MGTYSGPIHLLAATLDRGVGILRAVLADRSEASRIAHDLIATQAQGQHPGRKQCPHREIEMEDLQRIRLDSIVKRGKNLFLVISYCGCSISRLSLVDKGRDLIKVRVLIIVSSMSCAIRHERRTRRRILTSLAKTWTSSSSFSGCLTRKVGLL